jgi:hypothetical protein
MNFVLVGRAGTGPNSRWVKTKKTTLLVILAIAISVGRALAGAEYVMLIKVLENDDQGIIERRNGERWLIEKGIGALSFWHYEGKQILIYSTGLFCGIGSKVILPDVGQQARIWNAEPIALAGRSQNGAGLAVGDQIESQIDGDFEGWEGETVLKLTNGQLWQQTEYYYHYYYAFMPNVIILKTTTGYKMLVDGIPKAVGVTQLK